MPTRLTESFWGISIGYAKGKVSHPLSYQPQNSLTRTKSITSIKEILNLYNRATVAWEGTLVWFILVAHFGTPQICAGNLGRTWVWRDADPNGYYYMTTVFEWRFQVAWTHWNVNCWFYSMVSITPPSDLRPSLLDTRSRVRLALSWYVP